MKTAFFPTDCSVDSALALQRWLVATPLKAIQVTVVHPYVIEAGITLNKESYRVAKQQAIVRLEHWLALLPPSWPGELKTETLLASPELAVTIYLLLRPYNYLLVDDQPFGLPATTILNQTTAKLCRLAGLGSTTVL
ncbi:hypothetical protein [Spirosoma areae]